MSIENFMNPQKNNLKINSSVVELLNQFIAESEGWVEWAQYELGNDLPLNYELDLQKYKYVDIQSFLNILTKYDLCPVIYLERFLICYVNKEIFLTITKLDFQLYQLDNEVH